VKILRRIFLNKIVRVLVSLTAVIALAVLAVQIFLPAEKIKELALAQVRTSLGREVSAGDVAVSLRGGLGIRIADFTIQNPPDFAGEPLLAARALELKLALGPLLQGEVNVTRLVLDGPRVHLVRRADGIANFVFEKPATQNDALPTEGDDGAESAPPLVMSDVRLVDGEVFFSDGTLDPAQFESLRFLGCQMELGVVTDDSGVLRIQGDFAAEKIAVLGPQEIPEISTQIKFDVRWSPGTSELTIVDTDLLIADVPLECQGEFSLADENVTGLLHLQARDMACVDLAPFLPAEFAQRVKGDESSGQLQATVDISFDSKAQPAVEVTGDLAVSDLDLSLAQPFMPPGQAGKIAGRADLNLEFAKGKSLNYSGDLVVRKMSYRDASLVDELEALDAQLRITPDEIVVTSSEARFSAGTFSLTGKLSDPLPYFLPPEMQPSESFPLPHLTFKLSTKHLDVDRLVPVASPVTTKSIAVETRSNQLTGEFPEWTASGVFRAESIIYMQVPLTDVEGAVTLADRQLKISNVQGSVYQGAVLGDLTVDLNDLNNPAFVGHYDLKNIEVDDFVSRFANLSGVLFGRFNMKGNFAANGLDAEAVRNSLSLDAGASLKAGHFVTSGNTHTVLSKLASQAGQSLATEQSLRDLASHISVSDGRIAVNALQTQLGQFGDLKVDGYYGFDGKLNYQGEVLLSAAQTSDWFSDGGLLSGLGDLMGSRRPQRLMLPLTVGGTRTQPKFNIDFALVTKDMQQRVIDEQGEKLTQSLADEAKKKLGGLFDKWK